MLQEMSISRRGWLLGTALSAATAGSPKTVSCDYQRFSPAVAEAALKRAIALVNMFAAGRLCWNAAAIAATLGVTEALFANFDESGFHLVLDNALAACASRKQPRSGEIVARMREHGMNAAYTRTLQDLYDSSTIGPGQEHCRTAPRSSSVTGGSSFRRTGRPSAKAANPIGTPLRSGCSSNALGKS
jgi:hypothetical protein